VHVLAAPVPASGAPRARAGDPRGEAASLPQPPSPVAGGNSALRWQPSGKGLQRTTTSRYTTKCTATADDLRCQICLGMLRSCVALEPCGHNYCAVCLSNHFAALLEARRPRGARAHVGGACLQSC